MAKQPEFHNKNILVVGLGRSGSAAAAFLKSRGARVTVTDIAPESELAPLAAEMRRLGVSLELGTHRMRSFETAELIILSPGVPRTISPLVHAERRGVPVWGEIELAYRFIEKPLVAVTGTNGKTTVTKLLGEMLAKSGVKAFVGGNIGKPLTGYVHRGQIEDVVVVEVSSFQLDTVRRFRPDVGVLLNITEDHLDRYSDFSAYARSKLRLFENQRDEDIAVLNGSDPAVQLFCRDIACRRISYFRECDGFDDRESGACVNGSRIRCRTPRNAAIRFDLSRMKLTGRHNHENAAAASLGALSAGATPAGVQQALDAFDCMAHRMEPVATIGGVRFINDSKATNVDAVARAVDGLTAPVVLIMGGRDKGGDFTALRETVGSRVKALILVGEAKERIAGALGDVAPAETVSNMREAVAAAAGRARSGDVVLLSPACASFDQFKDYAHRGDVFKEAVERLK